MTGQDAVASAHAFHSLLALTGVILTKMDGDARGGAALSIRHVTGAPIKFLGTGERPDAFEPFHPDRIVSRIMAWATSPPSSNAPRKSSTAARPRSSPPRPLRRRLLPGRLPRPAPSD